ncbi:MAG: NAD-dependent epimerase/dehydratase family protein [Magnetococcales bacterium]|nr:NAD-dependent epimerase/dehydratase family protein [Magnetococcales bacterium]
MEHFCGRIVLVTGGGGFLAANLCRRLLELGARVHVVVRPATGTPWRWRGMEAQPVPHYADLADGAAIQEMVGQVAPEYVFHLAATGGYQKRVIKGPILADNVLGTCNLLTALASVDCRCLVYTAGSLELGPQNEPLTETTPLRPVSFYGAAKAAATLFVQQATRESGQPCVILRPFSIYGPWEAPGRLIPSAIRAALTKTVLPLTPPGLRRDFIFVADVVDACLLAATTPRACGETMHIASGIQSSNEEVVACIQKILGEPIVTAVGAYPLRQSDMHHRVVDNRKAGQLLGWQPRHTLEQGLARTIDWFRATYQEL